MMGRGLFAGMTPPLAMRGQLRQALAGGDSPGASSRARARQQGRPLPGQPGSEGTRPNGGLLPDTAEALASNFNRVNGLRRGSAGGSGQRFDATTMQEVMRHMMEIMRERGQ